MTKLVDTTIRLLSQEPLATRVRASQVLEVAELLDAAGFATLEVSGGGCFDAAVRHGVESPWERIRALRARCDTPLGMALRGRFLVGSRPLSPDLVRRFVGSAAENGIDVFRIHDPLNDLENLSDAAAAIHETGKELAVGLVHSPGPEGATDVLLERAEHLEELKPARVLIHDPTGSLDPAGARALVERVREASGLPVGLHTQGSGGAALAAALEAARGGADRIACAIYPVALALHRVAGESLEQALDGLDLDAGVDVDKLWEACELVDDALGEDPLPPLSPRVAVRAAEHRLPAGLVAELDASLRRQNNGDRLDAVLDELTVIRGETGWPPLASPIGHILGTQALIHVLSAQRWQFVVDELRDLVNGRYGATPGEVDPAVRRALALVGEDTEEDVTAGFDELRKEAGDIAASEEELLLLALFGEDAEPLLTAIRSRGRREDADAGLGRGESERLRDLIRVVQESGIGEVTIEEGDARYTVRRAGETAAAAPVAAAAQPAGVAPEDSAVTQAPVPPRDDVIRIEAPMVGTFYRSPSPDAAPFVEVGDAVGPGQTLCILEAMKLMNEIKADREALVRRVCVENESAVEYGDLLFELEPLNGRPLDAL